MSQNLNQTQIDLIKKELSLNNKELTPQQEKFLRLTGHKTFTFPKRKRVNENLDDEIMSQRSGAAKKMSGMAPDAKLLTRNNILERQMSEGTRFKTGPKSGTKGDDLRSFFSSKHSNASRSIVKNGHVFELGSSSPLGDAQNATYNSSNYRKKFINRLKDLGNPRYAASKHSSFMGGLVTGVHATMGTFQDSAFGSRKQSKVVKNEDVESIQEFLDDEIDQKEDFKDKNENLHGDYND